MYKNSIGYIFLLVIMMILYIVDMWYLVSSNNLLPTPYENLNYVKIPDASSPSKNALATKIRHQL